MPMIIIIDGIYNRAYDLIRKTQSLWSIIDNSKLDNSKVYSIHFFDVGTLH